MSNSTLNRFITYSALALLQGIAGATLAQSTKGPTQGPTAKGAEPPVRHTHRVTGPVTDPVTKQTETRVVYERNARGVEVINERVHIPRSGPPQVTDFRTSGPQPEVRAIRYPETGRRDVFTGNGRDASGFPRSEPQVRSEPYRAPSVPSAAIAPSVVGAVGAAAAVLLYPSRIGCATLHCNPPPPRAGR